MDFPSCLSPMKFTFMFSCHHHCQWFFNIMMNHPNGLRQRLKIGPFSKIMDFILKIQYFQNNQRNLHKNQIFCFSWKQSQSGNTQLMFPSPKSGARWKVALAWGSLSGAPVESPPAYFMHLHPCLMPEDIWVFYPSFGLGNLPEKGHTHPDTLWRVFLMQSRGHQANMFWS